MMIKNYARDDNYMEGQPNFDNFSIRFIVVNVNCSGLEWFISSCINEQAKSDDGIKAEIKKAIDYCRNERCDEDYKNGQIVSYCPNCSKSNIGINYNIWELAGSLYRKLSEV